MMWWRNPHRRYQERFSAYLDGELPPGAAAALELHVESCETCTKELAEFRLLSGALAELPEVDVPRSFALAPEQVSLPAGGGQTLRTLNSGLRVTGGALAAALALVLVLDVGGIVGNGDESPGGGSTGLQSEATYDSASRAGENPAIDSPGALTDSGATPGTAGGVAGSPVPSPQPTATVPESFDTRQASPSAEPPASTETPGEAAGELGLDGEEAEATGPLADMDTNLDSEGDGLSAVTVTEIVLAALLGASIIGLGAATYAGRRRG